MPIHGHICMSILDMEIGWNQHSAKLKKNGGTHIFLLTIMIQAIRSMIEV